MPARRRSTTSTNQQNGQTAIWPLPTKSSVQHRDTRLFYLPVQQAWLAPLYFHSLCYLKEIVLYHMWDMCSYSFSVQWAAKRYGQTGACFETRFCSDHPICSSDLQKGCKDFQHSLPLRRMWKANGETMRTIPLPMRTLLFKWNYFPCALPRRCRERRSVCACPAPGSHGMRRRHKEIIYRTENQTVTTHSSLSLVQYPISLSGVFQEKELTKKKKKRKKDETKCTKPSAFP